QIFRILFYGSVVASLGAASFAVAPTVAIAIAAHALIGGALVIVGPGVMASLSLAIPPRARAMGFSVGALWVLPGLVVIPLVGWLGDNWGFRWGLLILVPVFMVGGILIASVGSVIDDDIAQVWLGTATRAQMLQDRIDGKLPLLSLRGVQVSYGDIQVLFGVDLDVNEGEIIALLGTNGAGKSTLLKSISGLAIADRGVIVFDGRDITHAPADEISPRGIAQVPGGDGVFPELTVDENLRAAGWLLRHDSKLRARRVEEALELFPILEVRRGDPAVNLSGGQQQMLALAMAFMAEPKVLMIDELSLGLAPTIVEQLLEVLRKLRDRGMTIILVEQSVNVALTVADTAYFMEKGEIRFHGPTAELLDRPDILRSVFLTGISSDEASDGVASTFSPEVETKTVQDEGVQSEAALSVEGITVQFGGVRAVDNVSFSVAPGETVGLIGPNGAGKTTMLDIISGHTAADMGRVLLAGVDITKFPSQRRAALGLGRSFQDSLLFPSLTVNEVLLLTQERFLAVRDPLNAVFRTPPFVDSEFAATQRAIELMELLGLGRYRNKFIGELSTGTRRIVELGCVLAHEPSVILLDEPSSGVAQREVEALGPLLMRVKAELGASLVVIEHDMSLISSISDRLVALDQGGLLTSGSPAEVLEHPAVIESYLGGDASVIARSDQQVGSQPEDDGAEGNSSTGADESGSFRTEVRRGE
ncbi:MAG TPA: ATP-binding cassette domain-containing protein, partial [Microthrixaceae bacterium]|nr:ATP-binding cassette domain-containing protein [Microthrixaceae bacterium]